MHQPSRLRLHDYYVIEGFNAFACTILGSCIYFWTRARYGYADATNLWLGCTQGLFYVLVPPLGGRLGDRFGHSRIVLVGTLGMILASVLLLAVHRAWMPFLALPVFIASMSLTWPSLEASVVLHPGPLSTPDRLGVYNVVWACIASFSFFSAGALFRITPDAILVAALLVHVMQAAWLLVPRRVSVPFTGERKAHRGDHVPQSTKRRFKQLGWLGNGTGYLLQGGMMTLAPSVGERLGLPPASAIWMICTFFAARAISFALLWRLPGWHYRLPLMLAALVAAPAALATIFFATSLALLLPALMLFGACIGLNYYSSIYYSLDYGDEKGEHGGWHESIIGLGGLIGPLAGVIGAALLGTGRGAPLFIVGTAAVIIISGWTAIMRSTAIRS